LDPELLIQSTLQNSTTGNVRSSGSERNALLPGVFSSTSSTRE
jgi:hypothetical protein